MKKVGLIENNPCVWIHELTASMMPLEIVEGKDDEDIEGLFLMTNDNKIVIPIHGVCLEQAEKMKKFFEDVVTK